MGSWPCMLGKCWGSRVTNSSTQRHTFPRRSSYLVISFVYPLAQTTAADVQHKHSRELCIFFVYLFVFIYLCEAFIAWNNQKWPVEFRAAPFCSLIACGVIVEFKIVSRRLNFSMEKNHFIHLLFYAVVLFSVEAWKLLGGMDIYQKNAVIRFQFFTKFRLWLYSVFFSFQVLDTCAVHWGPDKVAGSLPLLAWQESNWLCTYIVMLQ